jgi:phosphoribosylformylglycinamidine cyclo-ligase
VADGSGAHRDSSSGGLTYHAAGVDIAAGEEAVRLIKEDVESTYIPGVLGSLGGFAGLFQLPTGLEEPVLVTSTDGVGTKILLAQEMGRLDTVGIDLVAMSVNDVLTTGARPILFLDYIAVGRLVPAEMAQMVAGVAEGCRQAGCALVGGEMAEMSGLYDPGEFDMAGFCVGIGERKKLIDGSTVAEGDVVLGLASNGLHSNGFSLARKVLEENALDLGEEFPDPDSGSEAVPETPGGAAANVASDVTGRADATIASATVADVVLRPTRIYVQSVLGLLAAGVPVRGMAHVTGGGIASNMARVIPDGLFARLEPGAWTVPPVFQTLQRLGGISDEQMFLTFNMGIGYILVVARGAENEAARLLSEAGEGVVRLGEIVRDEASDGAASGRGAAQDSGGTSERAKVVFARPG